MTASCCSGFWYYPVCQQVVRVYKLFCTKPPWRLRKPFKIALFACNLGFVKMIETTPQTANSNCVTLVVEINISRLWQYPGYYENEGRSCHEKNDVTPCQICIHIQRYQFMHGRCYSIRLVNSNSELLIILKIWYFVTS